MTERRNIVLVSVDSLRADRCGFLGDDQNLTPELDGLASDGLVFENAVAPGPRTPDSMPTVFTGRHALERNYEVADFAKQKRLITRHLETRYTIPEALSQAGYNTAAFTPNPYTSRYFGFDSGFDHFRDFMSEWSRRFSARFDRLPQTMFDAMRLTLTWSRGENVSRSWESFYDDIRTWVRSADEPYFLWVFLMDPHNPYVAPADYRTQSFWSMWRANLTWYTTDNDASIEQRDHERLVRAYDDTVRYVDAFFGQLRNDLAEDDPVYVIHADHGESLGEHGTYGHLPFSLYEENIHVPFVLANGGIEGRRSEPVSLSSIAPTLVELAGATATFPGTNLLAEEYHPPWTIAKAPVADSRRLALRTGPYKFIDSPGYEGELYDLRADPTERHNLVLTQPGLARLFGDLVATEDDREAERRVVRTAIDRLDSGEL